MDHFYSLQKDLFAAIGVDAVMVVCMVIGVLAMAIILWAAKPGRLNQQQIVSMGCIIIFGLGAAVLDASPMNFSWMKYAVAIMAPVVVWGVGRQCWTGYLTPWAFSWRRIGLLMLAIWAMWYLIVKAMPHDLKDVIWAPYFFTLLLSPLFAFKALTWWVLFTLKTVYIGKRSYEKESTKPVDVYFTVWWNDKVRRRKVDQAKWLVLTKQYPQFIESRWWQKKGAAFWPDMMEWDAKLGTLAMLWFIQQRMESPPEVLDDYSDAVPSWVFSEGPRVIRETLGKRSSCT